MRPILPLAALLAMACGGPPPPDLLLTYEVVPTGTLVDVDAATLDAVPVVKARLDAVGARGIVSAGPDHTLTVRVDGTHADALQASLRAVGSLAIHGVDDGWTELDLRRLAYDADLPPGDVRGLDAWAHAEGRLPADHVLVAQRMPWMDPPPPPLVLFAAPLLTGADLADATASVDELGQPLVSLEFTPTGARRFEAITAAAVGRRLAIVIDGEVESAPTVRAPISGGVAQIQLDPGHDAEDAAGLAVALRTGALPTALRLVASEVVPAEGQPSMP